jgi:hypothetical protein
MEAICSSETSVETQRTTRRHIPEDDTLHNHRRENLKSNLNGYLIDKKLELPKISMKDFRRKFHSTDESCSKNIRNEITSNGLTFVSDLVKIALLVQ